MAAPASKSIKPLMSKASSNKGTFAEIQIQKDASSLRQGLDIKKTMQTIEEKVSRLETCVSQSQKDKASLVSNLAQKEKEHFDLLHRQDALIAHLEKSERTSLLLQEKVSKYSAINKKVEDLEKQYLYSKALCEKQDGSLKLLLDKETELTVKLRDAGILVATLKADLGTLDASSTKALDICKLDYAQLVDKLNAKSSLLATADTMNEASNKQLKAKDDQIKILGDKMELSHQQSIETKSITDANSIEIQQLLRTVSEKDRLIECHIQTTENERAEQNRILEDKVGVIIQLQDSFDKTNSTHARFVTESDNTRATYDSRCSALNGELQDSKVNIDELNETNVSLTKSLCAKDVQLESSKGEIQLNFVKLTDAHARLELLNGDFEAFRQKNLDDIEVKELEISALSQSVQTLQTTQTTLQHTIRNSEVSRNDLEADKEKISLQLDVSIKESNAKLQLSNDHACQLESYVSEKMEEIVLLTKSRDLLLHDNAEYEQKVQSLTEERVELAAKLEEAVEAICVEVQHRELLSVQLKERASINKALEDDLAIAAASIKGYNETICRINAEIDTKSIENSKISIEMAKIKGDVLLLESDLQQSKTDIISLGAEKLHLDVHVEQEQNFVKQLNEQIESMTRTYDDLASKLEIESASKSRAKEEIGVLNAASIVYASRISGLEEKICADAQAISSAIYDCQQLDMECNRLRNLKDEFSGNCEELGVLLEDLKVEKSSLELMIVSLTQKYNDKVVLDLENTKLFKKKLEMESSAHLKAVAVLDFEMNAKVAALESKVQFHVNINDQYLVSVEHLNSDIALLKVASSEQEEHSIQQLEDSRAELSALQVLSAEKETGLANIIESLKDQVSGLDIENSRNARGLAEKAKEIELLGAQISAIQAELDISRLQSETTFGELEDSRMKCIESNSLLSASETRISELESQLKVTAQNVINGNISLVKTESDLTAALADVTYMKEEFRESLAIQARENELTRTDLIFKNEALIDDFSQRLSEQSTMVLAKETEISELKVAALALKCSTQEAEKFYQSSMKDFESQNESLNQHINQLTENISVLESNIVELNGRIESADAALVITRISVAEFKEANKTVLEEFERSKNELSNHITSMDLEREGLRSNIGVIDIANQALKEANAAMQHEMKSVAASFGVEKEQLNHDMQSLRQECIDFKSEIARISVKTDLLESENESFTLKFDAQVTKADTILEGERACRRAQITSLHSKHMALTSEIESCRDQVVHLEQERSKQEMLIQMLDKKHTSQILGKDSQIRSLEDQLKIQTETVESKKAMVEEVQYLNHEKNQLVYDLDIIKCENQVLDRKVHDLLNGEMHERRAMKSQYEARQAEIMHLKSDKERIKKEAIEAAKKVQKQLLDAQTEVKLSKAKEAFVTSELLKAAEDQSGQVGHNNAKQKIKLFSQLKEENELEADKLSKDGYRRRISALEREVEGLSSLVSTGGSKPMSKAQRAFRAMNATEDSLVG